LTETLTFVLKVYSADSTIQLNLKNPNFCEENYCDNYTLSSLSTIQQNWIFFVKEFFIDQQQCRVCSYGYNQTSFVERVKNGSCSFSNNYYKPWGKCGKLMEFEDIAPYPTFPTTLCYSYKENLFFYENDLLNRSVIPVALVEILFMSIFSFTLSILIFFTMFIPELKELLKLKKIFGFGPKIRFIFSLLNQGRSHWSTWTNGNILCFPPSRQGK
jgi:hypothetical protein